MGLKISDLLKWRTAVTLLHDDKPILDEDGKEVKVWVRIVGDHDLQEAYRVGRVASRKIRTKLQDPESVDYAESVEPLNEATQDECLEIIRSARASNLYSEALSSVVRPDEVKIEEIAIDPDAPSLEEMERLDAENLKIDEEYIKALEDYQEARRTQIEHDLSKLTLEELREVAKGEVATVVALTTFLTEVQDQKIWRSVYTDNVCKTRAFNDVEDYRSTASEIKAQILDTYLKLEQNPEQLKN